MKKTLFYLLILMTSCSNKEKNAAVPPMLEVENGIIYNLDSTSKVQWSASRPGETYNGVFATQNGKFIVKDKALAGGQFTIDILSLDVWNLSVADGKNKFIGHLKSPDFFNADKYPTAKFEITSIEKTATEDSLNIGGNLTLRDSIKNIHFIARVTVADHSLSAKASFDIDRTDWGINYKGAGNPQNWIISKKVNLQLDVAATRN